MADAAKPKFSEQEYAELEKLEKLHGQIHPWRLDGGKLVVFRKPKRAEWHRYNADPLKAPKGSFDQYQHDDTLILSMCCLGDVNAVLDERPGLHELFLDAIKALASGGDRELEFLGKDWKRPDATT